MSEVLTRSDYKQVCVADYDNIVLQKITEGQAVFGWAEFTVPGRGEQAFQVKTGDVISHIFSRQITTNASELDYGLWENASFTEGTTEVPFVNMNRNKKNEVAPLTTYADPTNIDYTNATQIEYEVQRASGVAKKASTLKMEGVERILEPNTDYIFRFENPTNASAEVFVKFFFYFWNKRFQPRILER